MLKPHGSPMKWPGSAAEEEAGDASVQNTRISQVRSQDDAAVQYVFQREPLESELQTLAPKQFWAVGDDSVVEVCSIVYMYYLYTINICIFVYKI